MDTALMKVCPTARNKPCWVHGACAKIFRESLELWCWKSRPGHAKNTETLCHWAQRPWSRYVATAAQRIATLIFCDSSGVLNFHPNLQSSQPIWCTHFCPCKNISFPNTWKKWLVGRIRWSYSGSFQYNKLVQRSLFKALIFYLAKYPSKNSG